MGKIQNSVRLLGATIVILCSSTVVFAQSSSVNYVPGEVIVKLKSQSQPGISGKGMGNSHQIPFLGKAQNEKGMSLKSSFSRMGVYHFSLKPGQSVNDAVVDLENDPAVEYAEPNYIFGKETVGGVNQTFSASEVEGMNSASSYLATGAPIEVVNSWSAVEYNITPVVAVIDTGLDLTHPVFTNANAIWSNSREIPGNGIDDDGNGYVDDVNGWNFVANSKNMIDDDGHGTHVAGIILGTTLDIYSSSSGAAPIKIMPLKFLDGSGQGKTSDAIKAIYYAVNNGATVMNNSWGGPSYSAALHEAIVYAYNAQVLFVAAAGNNGSNNDLSPIYPSNYLVPNVVTVAATTDSDALAYFSNYGTAHVHLASPGVFILSTLPGGGYGSMSGTSMATPFVSGLAAMVKAERPTMLPHQMKQVILDGTDIIVDGSGIGVLNSKVSSRGRMNVYNTVQYSKTVALETSQPEYIFSDSRQMAATVAGGCGVVTKMIRDGRSGRGGGGSAPEGWTGLLFAILLLMPVLLYNHLKKRDPAQRRAHDRFNIQSEVKVKVGEKELIGSISTISMGGVQLNTEALLEQGGIVSMTIRSPDGKDQIAVEGRVVWSEAKKAYGVQFAETSKSVREQIANWTTALQKT